MIAPMVNSATAEALRPGALTMRTPRSRAAARSMLTGPPRATTISLSAGMRLSIAAENGASWVIAISAEPTKRDDRLGVALVFLEAVHSRLGVAVPHRLVGPRQLHGRDIDWPVAAGADRRLERRGRHEPIADDGDFRSPSASALISLLQVDQERVRGCNKTVIFGRGRLVYRDRRSSASLPSPGGKRGRTTKPIRPTPSTSNMKRSGLATAADGAIMGLGMQLTDGRTISARAGEPGLPRHSLRQSRPACRRKCRRSGRSRRPRCWPATAAAGAAALWPRHGARRDRAHGRAQINRAHIVGASMGGMIAQIVAADYPERVKSLVSLMSTSGNPIAGPSPRCCGACFDGARAAIPNAGLRRPSRSCG